MEVAQTFPLLPGDPRLIDHIVCELKSQGIFDQFRKECISDVDTKPAYQNLRQRVEGSVAGFLSHQKWKPELNKNQLREKLRKHISDSNFLDQGVERIVDQVVNPKIASVFIPQVEEVVYKCFGLERPTRAEGTVSNGVYDSASCLQGTTDNLLPNDLESVSPNSSRASSVHEDKPAVIDPPLPAEVPVDQEMKIQMPEVKVEEEIKYEKSEPKVEYDSDSSKSEEFESPAFEPIEDDLKHEASPNHSHLSGISDLTSHDSNESSNPNENAAGITTVSKPDIQNTDSQLSQVSSDSNLSMDTSNSDNKLTIATEENFQKVTPKIDSSDASNTPCYKFTNDDDSSDTRQCFEPVLEDVKNKLRISAESDVNDSMDHSFAKIEIQKQKDVEVPESTGGSISETVSVKTADLESIALPESNMSVMNMDISMDSNDSKFTTSMAKQENKDAYTFENKITAMDTDDSSSNGLKIDIKAEAKHSENATPKSDQSANNDVFEMKSPTDDYRHKSHRHKDHKSRSRDSERRSSGSFSSSKDHKDKGDESKHLSKSSHSRHSSGRHDSERKHSSSSSHDKREDSHSKSVAKDLSVDKEKYGKSNNGESKKESKDRHSSSHRSSGSSSKHSSSKHSSSSKHHQDKERHSLSRHDSKDSHKSDKGKDASKSNGSKDSFSHSKAHSSRHGEKTSEPTTPTEKSKSSSHSSHRDKSGSSRSESHSDKIRRSSSHSTSDKNDKKQDDKRKSKSKDDHCNSSSRRSRSRRSTDRDSNDGNNSSARHSTSQSTGSTSTNVQSTSKEEKSSNSGTENSSNGNTSSGQSDTLKKDLVNITSGGYIKSEFNMFQPVPKKPTLLELNIQKANEAAAKKAAALEAAALEAAALEAAALEAAAAAATLAKGNITPKKSESDDSSSGLPELTPKKPAVHVDSQLDPVKLVSDAVPLDNQIKLKKPRFASNIFEARKLMKVRKQMEKMEKKRQQEAIELMEKQQNIPKSASQVFSGQSGPELEFACVKSHEDTHHKDSATSRRLSKDSDYLAKRKDHLSAEAPLLYFDNDPKSKSYLYYERSKKQLNRYLLAANGLNEKFQLVLHFIKCDSALEKAFKRLSSANMSVKTVNLHQNGTASEKKANAKKLDLCSRSELQIRLDSGPANSAKPKRQPMKRRKAAAKKKAAKNIEIKSDVLVEIKPDTVQEKAMLSGCTYIDADISLDVNRSLDSSLDYGNSDYYEQIDDIMNKTSQQDIMQIILGGEMNFGVDLNRVQDVPSKDKLDITKSVSPESSGIQCDMSGEESSENKSMRSNRKRKISFRLDEDNKMEKLNFNNNVKDQKKQILNEKRSLIMSIEESAETISLTNKKTARKVSAETNLGKARRVGLSKLKRTFSGISKNEMNSMPLSPESDKSIENHHEEISFTRKTGGSFSEGIETTALNQANHQSFKRKKLNRGKAIIQNRITEKLY